MLQITNTSKAFNNHFLKVSKSKGLFILKRPNDEAEFDTVGGSINRIETRIHKTKDGKEFILWHLLLNDDKIGDSYDISFPENSGLFVIIMRCLASEEGLKGLDDIQIQIKKSEDGNFLNATVRNNGKSIGWLPGAVPPIMYTKEGKGYKADFSKRQEWLHNLAGIVNWAIESGEIISYSGCDEEYNENEMESSEDEYEL